MPTLSQIIARKKALVVPWGDIVFHVEYRPGKFTGNLIAEVEESGDLETVSRALASLIDAWDITEDDGRTMFPLDPVRLGEIGLPVLMGIFNAMASDMRPEEVAPRNSKN